MRPLGHFRTFRAIASSRALVAMGFAVELLLAHSAAAQDPNGTVKDGYAIRQSFDLGGHIVSYSGSSAMYDTLVNLRSGPRILNETLDMHAVGKTKFPLFDTLTTASTGYGGDPNNFTIFRMSKGMLYDFQGLFRRDRQYFDYDLLDNPLIPSSVTSNGYTFPQVLNSPHLFNTVRRMTDVGLTLFPTARFSSSVGYSQNIMEGPTYSSVHYGTEALLLQDWHNSTDTWAGAVNWKLLSKTVLTYEQHLTHYKGDTSWRMGPMNLQLPNGAPVSLGFDNVTAPTCPGGPAILSSTTTPPTANPTCNGFLQYHRYSPTRTLYPTEEFRFQSSDIPKVQMNGRLQYTGANMNLPDYFESFNGLESRVHLRSATITGAGKAQRIAVTADFGFVLQVAQKLSVSEQYDFWNFKQPGIDNYTEIDYSGASMLLPLATPGTPTITSDAYFMGQKTQVNTVLASWQALPRANFSLGYRYRTRDIVYRNPDLNDIPVHEQGGLFGLHLRPSHNWRVNGNVELAYADTAFTRISPRQLQHYQLRTTYQIKSWATIFGVFNDRERRNNVTYVRHLDHSRAFSAGADLTPSQRYSVELNYGFLNVLTRTDECYTSTPPLPGASRTTSPACLANGTPYHNDGYYVSPVHYDSFAVVLTPVKRLQSGFGYRMTAVDGNFSAINPRQVPGALQSQYQSPFANLAVTVHPGWALKGDWNYYGYGEGTPIGPTLPRSFRGNIYTLGMHYEF